MVGGGVIAAGELLLAPARKVVARARAGAVDATRCGSRPTRFGDASGMIGAALLAMDLVDAR